MSGNWTPGPWVVGEQNGHCGISIDEASDEHARIATVYLGRVTSAAKWGEEHFALPENAEAMANARLIAAAPELVEALRDILDTSGARGTYHSLKYTDAVAVAEALLAKIEGDA